MKKTLIKCEKCGSTNVSDTKLEDTEITVMTMDDYIKTNKTTSLFNFSVGLERIEGVSHMDKRVLTCLDCGYRRPWDQVVYT